MNRKEIAELMSIIQAFLEGKTIERKTRSWELNKGWRDETQWEETEELICRDTFVYRIKPEPKPEPKPSYRPFANAEECWQEMQKHQPFGWVKSKDKGYFRLIGLVQFASELEDVMITFATSENLARSSHSIYENYIFADGTPFGVKVEE